VSLRKLWLGQWADTMVVTLCFSGRWALTTRHGADSKVSLVKLEAGHASDVSFEMEIVLHGGVDTGLKSLMIGD
jgi:hypothetical protein